MSLSTLLLRLLLSHKSLPGLYPLPGLQLTIENRFWDTSWKTKSSSICYMYCYLILLRDQCDIWIKSGRLVFKITEQFLGKKMTKFCFSWTIRGTCVVDACWDDGRIQEEKNQIGNVANSSLLPSFLSLSFFHLCQLLHAYYRWSTVQISQI